MFCVDAIPPISSFMAFSKYIDKAADLERKCREDENYANFPSKIYSRHSPFGVIRVGKFPTLRVT
jgi:hypothetical protein